MSTKNDTPKSPKSTTASGKKPEGFTDEERAAMKERAKELKAEARAEKNRAVGFEAESTNPLEMQRSGWQAILDNFKEYVEGEHHDKV